MDPRRTGAVRRRTAGVTLAETIVACSGVIVVLAIALPVFMSMNQASAEGTSQLAVQADNQNALLRLASELQNTSTLARDPLGNPRLESLEGDAPTPLLDPDGSLPTVLRGTIGTVTGVLDADDEGAAWDGDLAADPVKTVNGNGGNGLAGGLGLGKGDSGLGLEGVGSRLGRIRDKASGGSKVEGSAAERPRNLDFLRNSILRFQKVTGYGIDATGVPALQWGTPIEYRVEGNRLVRIEGAQRLVVSPSCAAFRAEVTDAGTVLVTIVTQKRTSETGRVSAQANQIEVGPKN